VKCAIDGLSIYPFSGILLNCSGASSGAWSMGIRSLLEEFLKASAGVTEVDK
jgi:hypothetical protein